MDGTRGPEGPIAVVVAVLTFQRLERLFRLLPTIIDHAADLDSDSAFTTRILVVDNDPGATARGGTQGLDARVGYVHEPRPGIAAARARAVLESYEADVLVFIDDDVEPRPGWLVHLLRTWLNAGRPAGVVGRVVPTYSGTLDRWIAAGGFFTRRTYPTGTPVHAGSSANLLLDRKLLRQLNLTFDARLGLRGGEDTLLTRTITAGGHSLVWCDEAEVIDPIPPSRMTRQWVLHRAFSHGAVTSRVEVVLSAHPARTRVWLIAQGIARVLAGSIRAILGALTHRTGLHARGSRMMHRGAGLLAGAMGRDVFEYARGKI